MNPTKIPLVILSVLAGFAFLWASDFSGTFSTSQTSFSLTAVHTKASCADIQITDAGLEKLVDVFDRDESSNEEDLSYQSGNDFFALKQNTKTECLQANSRGKMLSVPLYILFQSWKHFLS